MLVRIESMPSLNAALKKQPEIALYIPQAYIDKVNEQKRTTSQSRSEGEEVHLDVETLVATAVAHRFATAGGA